MRQQARPLMRGNSQSNRPASGRSPMPASGRVLNFKFRPGAVSTRCDVGA